MWVEGEGGPILETICEVRLEGGNSSDYGGWCWRWKVKLMPSDAASSLTTFHFKARASGTLGMNRVDACDGIVLNQLNLMSLLLDFLARARRPEPISRPIEHDTQV